MTIALSTLWLNRPDSRGAFNDVMRHAWSAVACSADSLLHLQMTARIRGCVANVKIEGRGKQKAQQACWKHSSMGVAKKATNDDRARTVSRGRNELHHDNICNILMKQLASEQLTIVALKQWGCKWDCPLAESADRRCKLFAAKFKWRNPRFFESQELLFQRIVLILLSVIAFWCCMWLVWFLTRTQGLPIQ